MYLLRSLTARVVVESKLVSGARRDTADCVGGTDGSDVGTERLWRSVAFSRQKVGPEASDMGRGHGGSGDGVLHEEDVLVSVSNSETATREERRGMGGG